MLSLEQWQWEIAHAEELQELARQAIAANNTEVVEAALKELNHTLAPNCLPLPLLWNRKNLISG